MKNYLLISAAWLNCPFVKKARQKMINEKFVFCEVTCSKEQRDHLESIIRKLKNDNDARLTFPQIFLFDNPINIETINELEQLLIDHKFKHIGGCDDFLALFN